MYEPLFLKNAAQIERQALERLKKKHEEMKFEFGEALGKKSAQLNVLDVIINSQTLTQQEQTRLLQISMCLTCSSLYARGADGVRGKSNSLWCF